MGFNDLQEAWKRGLSNFEQGTNGRVAVAHIDRVHDHPDPIHRLLPFVPVPKSQKLDEIGGCLHGTQPSE